MKIENGNFSDHNGSECSIQPSSSGEKESIWLGIDAPKTEILAADAFRLGIDTRGQARGVVKGQRRRRLGVWRGQRRGRKNPSLYGAL